jgi:NAD(P)-dependent dehydrogenase (short-subunit alcohol dehydrogenase family)
MSKVVLITGAARGIGAATALCAAREGYSVAVNYRSNADRAEQIVREIRALGPRAVAIQADTSQEADVVRLFREAQEELGPLDALVNNAGVVGQPGPVMNTSAEKLREVLDVNVIGYFLCAREAVRSMAGRGGAIVNVSSRLSVLGGAGEQVHYAATKAAIDALTVGLSGEVAPQGIRVNCVRPGIIATEIHAGRPADVLKNVEKVIPLRRIGSAEEVAEAIVWLLSDKASYISGSMLDVGGGR